MNIYDYHRAAMRTSPKDGHDKLKNGMMGLIGETGEIVDVVKKFLFQSTPDAQLPAKQLENELGDVMWYLAELADGMDCQLGGLCPSFSLMDECANKLKLPPGLEDVVLSMSESAVNIARLVSKNRPFKIQQEMRYMMKLCSWLARIAGTSLEKAADVNIAKLLERYPVEFDPKISMARYEE